MNYPLSDHADEYIPDDDSLFSFCHACCIGIRLCDYSYVTGAWNIYCKECVESLPSCNVCSRHYDDDGACDCELSMCRIYQCDHVCEIV